MSRLAIFCSLKNFWISRYALMRSLIESAKPPDGVWQRGEY